MPRGSKRTLLFSVTAADCDWNYVRGSGPGGQKRNKTSNAVRCTHQASGAVGWAQEHRSQRKNRELAFARMAASRSFESWRQLEVARRTGREAEIQRAVDREMKNIRVEVKRNGDWKTWTEDDLIVKSKSDRCQDA